MNGSSPPQQLGQPMGGGGGANPPSWMSQSGPSLPASFVNGQSNNHPQGQPNFQPSPSQHHAQMPSNGVPARSGPTPHPPNAPFPNQISSNMGPQFQFNGNGNQGVPSGSNGPGGAGPSGPQGSRPGQAMMPNTMSIPIPPPLERPRFEQSYKTFCHSKGIHHDHQLMSVESRPIDLYLLHVCVMREGGFAKVPG